MRLTLLSLPLPSLVSSQAVWNTGDGSKWSNNKTITSAIVADGVVDLSTGEYHSSGGEKGVFEFCSKLETVRLPESLRKIGDYAFYYCQALVHVDIPSGVNEIGKDAFVRCTSLETVTIPEGVVDLPDFIFYHCHSLRSVKLPSSLKTIGEHAFQSCTSLAKITFTTLFNVPSVGSEAFKDCNSQLFIHFDHEEANVERFADVIRSRYNNITVTPRRGKNVCLICFFGAQTNGSKNINTRAVANEQMPQQLHQLLTPSRAGETNHRVHVVSSMQMMGGCFFLFFICCSLKLFPPIFANVVAG